MDGPTSPFIADVLSRCTFPPAGTAVSCAVSGGADSLALLFLAHAHGLHLQAIHVDHGLRAESSTDIDVIRPITQKLNV
jgi:tRNA(Ile)-lysidine synthase